MTLVASACRDVTGIAVEVLTVARYLTSVAREDARTRGSCARSGLDESLAEGRVGKMRRVERVGP